MICRQVGQELITGGVSSLNHEGVKLNKY